MAFMSSTYHYAQDHARGISVKLGIVAGTHLIDGILHKKSLFLEYISSQISFSCEYFVSDAEVILFRDGEARSLWYRDTIIVPSLALIRQYNEAKTASGLGRISDADKQLLIADIKEAMLVESHNRAKFLKKNEMLPELKIIFVKSFCLDDEIRRLLNIVSTENGGS